eukprot:1186306-Prorocentrum_minimum.AAC.1
MVICVKSYDHFETRVRFLGLQERGVPPVVGGRGEGVPDPPPCVHIETVRRKNSAKRNDIPETLKCPTTTTNKPSSSSRGKCAVLRECLEALRAEGECGGLERNAALEAMRGLQICACATPSRSNYTCNASQP